MASPGWALSLCRVLRQGVLVFAGALVWACATASSKDASPAFDAGSAGTAGVLSGGSGGAPSSGGSAATDSGGSGGAAASGARGGQNASGGNGGSAGGGTAGGSSACDRPPARCHCETYDDHDYLFCGVDKTRAAAAVSCESLGMQLIRVDGMEEERWVYETAAALSMTGDLWSGGMDQGVDDWAWPDGTRFWSGAADGTAIADAYSHFRASEPNGSGDCVVMQSDHRWDDQDCSWLRNYVCEAPGGSSTPAPVDCTQPAPLGCTCTTLSSKPYLFCNELLGFEVARVVCLSAGLHLVRLEDALEDGQVRTIATQLGFDSYYADGSDRVNEGDWQWSDSAQTLFWSSGAAVNGAYVNWAAGEPNDSGDCLVVSPGPEWDDTDCVSHAYVCEGE